MGAADNAWGDAARAAAAARRSCGSTPPRVASARPPLNVKTEAGGTYNPFAAGAPLTIYATGVRNAYDLVWHPTASSTRRPTAPPPAATRRPRRRRRPAAPAHRLSASTAPTPARPSPASTTSTRPERLPLPRRAGGYYGHPNPTRGEYVLNGGNPTAGTDHDEVTQYPVGTQPDRNYRGAAYDFGKNYSPNGVIEYKGNAFGGALNGKLLVVRYSGGDDIIVLDAGRDGQHHRGTQTGIAGLTGLRRPARPRRGPAPPATSTSPSTAIRPPRQARRSRSRDRSRGRARVQRRPICPRCCCRRIPPAPPA